MKKIRVFIVDDDVDFAESLAEILEIEQGCEVELAFSGEEAIKKFRQHDFDITFMDVKLPGKNGVESFLEIRKFKPDAKVVMMTGYSINQLLDQAVENGALGILHKPIDVKKMFEMLDHIGPDGILIADDDPDFVESIKDVLEKNGKTVFVAKNGQEAVEKVLSNGIDILILDLVMPVLDGLETYLELKKTGHAVPTIIVTGYIDEKHEDIEKLQSMSVKEILRKPFEPDELLEIVERLSRNKQD